MVKIRKAKKEDLEGVYELFLELCKSEDVSAIKASKHLKILRQRRPDFEKSVKKELLKSIKDGSSLYLVAEDDGVLFGYCYGTVLKVKDAFFMYPKIGYLHSLVISKKHRGKGVASSLHTDMLNWFKKKGCSSVSLEVFVTNLAKEIYVKWGYKPFVYKMNKKLR